MDPLKISGQAVVEGVAVRYQGTYAVAVKKADQTIAVTKEHYHTAAENFSAARLPFLRGIVDFVESLYVGAKTFLFSVFLFWEEHEKRKEEWQEWISTGTGRRFTGEEKNKKIKKPKGTVRICLEKAGIWCLLLCFLLFAFGLFFLFPMFLADFLAVGKSFAKRAVCEGGIRLLIFFVSLLIFSKSSVMKRIFQYHGAVHKTMNGIENGIVLTVENVKKQSRRRKRCGTVSFFFITIGMAAAFAFVKTEILWQKVLFRLLWIPVLASVSYEMIRLTERWENSMTIALSKFGMWLQRFTTKEPENEMIEAAIYAAEAVSDHNAGASEYQEELAEAENALEEAAATKTGSEFAKERLYKTLSENESFRQRQEMVFESADEEELLMEDEEDAVLKALDKFFGE